MDLRKNLYVAPFHSKCPHGLPLLPLCISKSARVWKAMVLGLCPQPLGLLRHGVALKMVCEGIQGTNWDSKKKWAPNMDYQDDLDSDSRIWVLRLQGSEICKGFGLILT